LKTYRMLQINLVIKCGAVHQYSNCVQTFKNGQTSGEDDKQGGNLSTSEHVLELVHANHDLTILELANEVNTFKWLMPIYPH